MSRPPKKALTHADSLLTGLLGSPKSRKGLIAAVHTLGLSKDFVCGWLSTKVNHGLVSRTYVNGVVCYQIADLNPVIPVSQYPSWLEPRNLPPSSGRRIYRTPKLKVKPQHAKLPTSSD